MSKRDWNVSSNINDWPTLNNEHDWEDKCIKLRKQQTCTLEDPDYIRGGSIFIPISANATQDFIL